MKVLWLTFGVPYTPTTGGRIRDCHLIREVSKGADVSLFCLTPQGSSTDPGTLASFCREVQEDSAGVRSGDLLQPGEVRRSIANHLAGAGEVKLQRRNGSPDLAQDVDDPVEAFVAIEASGGEEAILALRPIQRGGVKERGRADGAVGSRREAG